MVRVIASTAKGRTTLIRTGRISCRWAVKKMTCKLISICIDTVVLLAAWLEFIFKTSAELVGAFRRTSCDNNNCNGQAKGMI